MVIMAICDGTGTADIAHGAYRRHAYRTLFGTDATFVMRLHPVLFKGLTF